MSSFDLFARLARRLILLALATLVLATYIFFNPPSFLLPLLGPTIEKLALRLHLTLDRTMVDITLFTPRDDVTAAVGVIRGQALPLIPAGEIKTRLEQLPMIASARVRIDYPQKQLRVTIVEKKIIAFLPNRQQIITNNGELISWSKNQIPLLINNQSTLSTQALAREAINKSSAQPTTAGLPSVPNLTPDPAVHHVITVVDSRPANSTPLIEKQFYDLYRLLNAHPPLLPLIDRAEWVGGRRWRLFLTRNPPLAVDLPEQPKAAIEQLNKLVFGDKILELKISRIDLRLPNQVIVRPIAPDK